MNTIMQFEEARRLLGHEVVLSPEEVRGVWSIPEYIWWLLDRYPAPEEWGSEHCPPVLPMVRIVPGRGVSATESVHEECMDGVALSDLLWAREVSLIHVSRGGHVKLSCTEEEFRCELAIEPEKLSSLSDHQLAAVARLIQAGLVTEYTGAKREEILAAAEKQGSSV